METKKENVSISFEGWLIEVLDSLSRIEGKSRSDFVCDALKSYILQKHQGRVWQTLYEDITNSKRDNRNRKN